MSHAPPPPRVVVSTTALDGLKRRTIADMRAAGLRVTVLFDAKFAGGEPSVDHAALRDRYGARNVEVFNGRWSNNPAKLGCIEHASRADGPVWCFEDDVVCRDWRRFVSAYAREGADLVATVFEDRDAFPEFYRNGWLVGHPDHLAHGVAGLYAFRISPALARAVLARLRDARHASHHELFVPWACAAGGFRAAPLLPAHAEHMAHNPDPRPGSGRRVGALPAGGLIFHPVKQGAVAPPPPPPRGGGAAAAPAPAPNPPKVRLWLVVNSFNGAHYASACAALLREIRAQLRAMVPRPGVLAVVGGCSADRFARLPGGAFALLRGNLSDYGAFVGVRDAARAGAIRPNDRCVLLHDTTSPKPGDFLRAMLDLQNAPPSDERFLFAHPLGWYNLGVGRADFLAGLGDVYGRVRGIPKELGYRLEHGKAVVVDGVTLPPLRDFSTSTLARHRVPAADAGGLTLHSTGAVVVAGKSRVVVYVAALGVYKYTHGPTSYQVPVWSDGDLPASEGEWRALRKRHPSMAWALPLVSATL